MYLVTEVEISAQVYQMLASSVHITLRVSYIFWPRCKVVPFVSPLRLPTIWPQRFFDEQNECSRCVIDIDVYISRSLWQLQTGKITAHDPNNSLPQGLGNLDPV